MIRNSWHKLQSGDRVSPDYIVAICEKRMLDGFTKPSSASWLRHCLALIGAQNGELRWDPQSWIGWGFPPFNPKNWRTLEDQRLVVPPEEPKF